MSSASLSVLGMAAPMSTELARAAYAREAAAETFGGLPTPTERILLRGAAAGSGTQIDHVPCTLVQAAAARLKRAGGDHSAPADDRCVDALAELSARMFGLTAEEIAGLRREPRRRIKT